MTQKIRFEVISITRQFMQDLRQYTKNMQSQQYEEDVFSNHVSQRLSVFPYTNEKAWEKQRIFIWGLNGKPAACKPGKYPVASRKKVKLSCMWADDWVLSPKYWSFLLLLSFRLIKGTASFYKTRLPCCTVNLCGYNTAPIIKCPSS